MKKLSSKTSRQSPTMRDMNGILLTETEDQLRRRKEHFSKLTQKPNNAEEQMNREIPQPTNEIPITAEPPSKMEISNAIKTLKNNESIGPDNIP
ncbi:hypothetical protein HHI36_011939, partial [Cryptolaemus montrouzieri]